MQPGNQEVGPRCSEDDRKHGENSGKTFLLVAMKGAAAQTILIFNGQN